jgi:hypothetical protein
LALGLFGRTLRLVDEIQQSPAMVQLWLEKWCALS